MGLAPDAFWNMTLTEWRAAVAGFAAGRGQARAQPLERKALNQLMQRYPDG
jgi:uncharacterized phage protein (TIGR02216 family)